MSMKMAVFWDVAPCSLVETDQLPDYTVQHNIPEDSHLQGLALLNGSD
jgi:hypothetical protein